MSAILLALAAAASTAAATPPSAPVAPAPAVAAAPAAKVATAGKPDEMICKRIATTGTRFATKDCRTRAEWDQMAADSRSATQEMSKMGGVTAGNGK